jgi:hypothetical protein
MRKLKELRLIGFMKFKIEIELQDSRYCTGCKCLNREDSDGIVSCLGMDLWCNEFESSIDVYEGWCGCRLPECIDKFGV